MVTVTEKRGTEQYARRSTLLSSTLNH